ncbi:phosphonoacetate hydrolase [Alsobacter sp. KACC 23698]|uniref:Phosphonoacetate hydrolase n=1 Tax=Alsobacter sp. KACC 23698 TaxID=3149229 RepID=A0AAU7JM73_9HYPH
MGPRRPAVITANGRDYAFPSRPTVVVCIDGSEPGYIEAAVEAGLAPNFARIMAEGANLTAQAQIPSFTNPNNISIITGRPPSVHGVAGNYFFDRATGEEVMMNDVRFLRAPTIMKAFQDAGAKVAVVTAKDKLRAMLGHGLAMAAGTAVAFSSEKADKATRAEHGVSDALAMVGMPLPDVYSAELSEFVMAAGVKLIGLMRPDLMYLSTTDYVQHKAAPGSPMANAFYAMMDRYVGELDALGCTLVLTADHGMNDKHLPDGQPDVLYLQDVMDEWLGQGAARVILPITDPYVVHHGALGSFATVYLESAGDARAVAARIAGLPGVEAAVDAEEACRRFDLPADRIGDVVVVSSRRKALGSSRDRHDLSGLTEPLRSHGGLTEQAVPMISNRRVTLPPGRTLRNFDAFDVALNHVQ